MSTVVLSYLRDKVPDGRTKRRLSTSPFWSIKSQITKHLIFSKLKGYNQVMTRLV